MIIYYENVQKHTNAISCFSFIFFIAKQYKIIFFFYLNLMVSKFIDNTIHYFVPVLIFLCHKASSVFEMANVEVRSKDK